MAFNLGQKLVGAGMSSPLAMELATQIDSTNYNWQRLMWLGMVPRLAKYVAESLATGAFNVNAAGELSMTEAQAVLVKEFEFSAESSALFARFTTPPTQSRKVLINSFVGSLRSKGIWAKMDGLYVFAAADEQAALLNWVASSYNGTKIGAINFTADRGFLSDTTTGQIDTGFNPTTAISPKFTLNSASLGLYSLTNTQSGVPDAGTTNSIILTRNLSDVFLSRLNCASNVSNPSTTSIGLFQSSRLTGASQSSRGPNGVVATSANASTALDNATIRFCGRGGTLAYSIRRQAFGYMGSGMTEGDMTAIDAACAAYMTGVGAA